MAITSSAIIPSNSLEEFRIEFNKLVTDVDGISAASAFGASISFEGATSDDFETTLIVTDPTADRTITLANATGTVLTTGNSDAGATTTSSGDADYVLIDDGSVLKKITPANLGVGTPTDITVADESSDTTCFPLFVTAVTGDLGPKSGTNLTFNSSTGLLTATSLSGGTVTSTGNLVIADAGTIGSATDADAVAIASDGIVTFTQDIKLDSDSSIIYFGDSQEITLTHVADAGVNLKHTATGDGTPIKLTLQTGENALTVGEQLGVIDFQAPGETSGTDAILVAAGIEAVAEEEFSATSNATKLSFKTASTDTAAETMSLSSGGNLTVEGSISAGSYNDNIVLNGTNGAAANAGDDLVLDSSAADTDVNSRVMYEDATGHNFIHDEREEVIVRDKLLLEEEIGYILVESNWGDGVITVEEYTGDIFQSLILTDGYGGSDFDLGTNASGTETLDLTNGNFQKGVNGGAHILSPQIFTSTIIVQYTNDASAGTLTTSGYTLVNGDSLTTTNGHDFMLYSTVSNKSKHLHVVALQ